MERMGRADWPRGQAARFTMLPGSVYPRSQERVNVFVVDDHPLVRQGLALVLEQGGFAVCGEADGIQATLDHPALSYSQVVVLDISLEKASGVDLIPVLCRRGLRVVVYSMHEDPAVVRRALGTGATGYVTKREAAQSLAHAIRTVAAGSTYISPRAAAACAADGTNPGPGSPDKLSG